jgi:hypothetical protein
MHQVGYSKVGISTGVRPLCPWQIKYLGQIRTQVVRMNRTWQDGCELLVEALKDAAMFPGVQILEVADWWEEEHLGGRQEACRSRGINAVELVGFDKCN